MNVPTPEEFRCNAVGCKQRTELADLVLPIEIANWLTGKEFTSLTNVEFCQSHWLELEDALQSGRYGQIPSIDPDQCTPTHIGMLRRTVHEPFPWTKYEHWKQNRLKKGRKFREQEDKSVYKIVEEKDGVLDDGGLSQRLVSHLVDDAGLKFGPAEEAKHTVAAELNSMEGIAASVINHSRSDLIIEYGDSLAAGDVVWIGEEIFEDNYPPSDMPIQKPGQWGSDPEWDVNLYADLNLKDIVGYSDDSVEKVFRVFVFEPLSAHGFIGMDNKYLDDSKAYHSTSSSEIENRMPAVIYGDFVSLPLISMIPEFLQDEAGFEELQEQRVETLNDEVPLSKKSYEYFKAKMSSLKV